MSSFRWIIADVVPVIVAVGTGVALSTYAGARCLYKNPEVFISKKARNDQLAENQEWFDAKSDLYRKSFFRSIGENLMERLNI